MASMVIGGNTGYNAFGDVNKLKNKQTTTTTTKKKTNKKTIKQDADGS